MAALTEVPVPDIGDFEDVPVIELLVAVGDAVAQEDPLVVLESDKATMEVPSPVAGTVRELKVAVGDAVSEGTVIAVIEGGGEPSSGGGAPGADAQAPDGGAGTTAGGSGDDARASGGEPGADDRRLDADGGASERTGGDGTSDRELVADDAASGRSDGPDGGAIYASPTVRRLARERGIDLATIAGTGRNGRITKEDVERGPAPGAAAATPPSAAAAGDEGGGLGLAPWPKVNFEKFGEIERVPLSRIQKISGPVLARNWVRIPHVTHNEDADITELEAFRKQTNGEQSDVKVTMVALLMKAASATLKAFPKVNTSLDGDDLIYKKYHHIGFAADTPNGLLVPVIRDVDKKGILEIAADLTELSGKARAGKLMPAEMSGGTFSISSLGGIGGTSFTPIVNAPEVAILGATRSAIKPVWNGSEFVPRLILPLSLSYDHRVIDGAEAARFCAHLSRVLADYRRIVL